MTPDEVRAGVDDIQAVAITLMYEAGGEPVEGKIAVGNVIRNRVGHPRRFSATYRGVCVQRSQFSCWWQYGGELNYLRLLNTAGALILGNALPLKELELLIFRECWYLAEGIIGGQLRDRVNGATDYFAPAAMKPKGATPKAALGRPTIKVGSQLFYTAL